jgi:hypothetical protein
MDEIYLTNQQVMKILMLNPKNHAGLRSRIKQGLKVSSGEGRTRRFKKSDVIAFLENRC